MITPKRHRKGKFLTPENNRTNNADNNQLITPVTGSSNKVVKLKSKDNSLETPKRDSSRLKSITERLFDCSNTDLVEKELAPETPDNHLGDDFGDDSDNVYSSGATTPTREEFDSGTISEPKTPENKKSSSIIQEESFESDSDSDVEITRIKHLENPFLSSNSPKLLNPFASNKKANEIDYGNVLELVDRRTGKKFTQKLSDKQKKIKPKKLQFGQFPEKTPSQTIESMNSNVIHFDRLTTKGSKKGLQFEIFNDSDSDPK